MTDNKKYTGTPKHDKLQAYVYENALEVVRKLCKVNVSEKDIFINKIELEKPMIEIKYNSKNIIGYLDVFIEFRIGVQTYKLGIEIKPYLDSLGGLLRQINKYKNFHPNIIYALVSPDDKYSKIIQEQGVRFLKIKNV